MHKLLEINMGAVTRLAIWKDAQCYGTMGAKTAQEVLYFDVRCLCQREISMKDMRNSTACVLDAVVRWRR
jgi:hypothetical protein